MGYFEYRWQALLAGAVIILALSMLHRVVDSCITQLAIPVPLCDRPHRTHSMVGVV